MLGCRFALGSDIELVAVGDELEVIFTRCGKGYALVVGAPEAIFTAVHGDSSFGCGRHTGLGVGLGLGGPFAVLAELEAAFGIGDVGFPDTFGGLLHPDVGVPVASEADHRPLALIGIGQRSVGVVEREVFGGLPVNYADCELCRSCRAGLDGGLLHGDFCLVGLAGSKGLGLREGVLDDTVGRGGDGQAELDGLGNEDGHEALSAVAGDCCASLDAALGRSGGNRSGKQVDGGLYDEFLHDDFRHGLSGILTGGDDDEFGELMLKGECHRRAGSCCHACGQKVGSLIGGICSLVRVHNVDEGRGRDGGVVGQICCELGAGGLVLNPFDFGGRGQGRSGDGTLDVGGVDRGACEDTHFVTGLESIVSGLDVEGVHRYGELHGVAAALRNHLPFAAGNRSEGKDRKCEC